MTKRSDSVRSEYLVEPSWLETRLHDPQLVIVDIDTEAAYLRGHVPGATPLHPDYERDPDTGWVRTLAPERFTELCRGLGIGDFDHSQVVVYDNAMSLYATRLWWVLKRYGHPNVRVMDGGWRSWMYEKRPINIKAHCPKNVETSTLRPDDSMLAVLDDVETAYSLDEAVIWDVRTEGEYDGSVDRGNRRVGHIAGAVHLEWSDLMDAKTHRFRPEKEIRAILTGKGITPDKKAYAY